jgi:transcriptional regulator with XRE-family HTH domain
MLLPYTPSSSVIAMSVVAKSVTAMPVPIGALLREWRAVRRLSQLDLALDAGISARHLSCVETGKAQASRELIARLADVLEMPLRERNALMVAAGYAPSYRESALSTPEMARVRRAIEFMLEQQEPYPAFLLNRHWDVLMANQAAQRVNHFVMRGRASAHSNMLRQIFDPDDLRHAVGNWQDVAGSLIHHLHSEIAAAPTDTKARALLEEILAYPGVPARWRNRELEVAPSPLLTTVLHRDEHEFRFFSSITTFGTPRDVTLEELRIECCFPEDDATAELCRQLSKQAVA